MRLINNQIVPAFAPLYELMNNKHVRYFFMWGGRGGAKSIGMGDFLLAAGTTETARYLCARETQKSIAESVHSLLRDRINQIGLADVYLTKETEIDCTDTGTQFLFSGISNVTQQRLKSFYDALRCWVEEAQALSDRSIKILLPTIRGIDSKIYFTYNRQKTIDAVHALYLTYSENMKTEKMVCEINGKKYFWVLHRSIDAVGIEINYDGNIYFPEVLEKERMRDKINLPIDEYVHIWEGAPEPQPGDAIIARQVVLKAIARKPDEVGQWTLGVDVARGGRDSVVIALKKGHHVFPLIQYRNLAADTIMRINETGERVIRAIPGGTDEEKKQVLLNVDDTGLGGGLTDWLLERGYNVAAINFAQTAIDKDRYRNAISEMWFNFSKIINTFTLPNDAELIEELCNRAEIPRDNRGRRSVEPKDRFKERLGRSPDKADAVLLACYEGIEIGIEYI